MKTFDSGIFVQDDCFAYMATLPDCSVDMVLADLPYGIVNWTNPYVWDSALDLKKLFGEYLRICRPKAPIILFGSEPYSTFQRNQRPDLFKYDIIWVKNKVTTPFLAKVKPLRSYEIISVFSQGTTAPGRPNNMPYYPQGLIHKPKTVKNTMTDRMTFQKGRPSLKEEYTQEYTNYPKDVIHFDSDKGFHPTQKPVALCEYLIKTYSREGDVVLDNTAGSGTTAIAAHNTKRKWICVERDQEYSDKAVDRITRHIENDALISFS